MYSIGIVGPVGSGKSTLIQNLNLENKGILHLTRETDPEKAIDTKMYHIQDINGFDLLEYPGIDEAGINEADLEDAVLSRSQLVVFVTCYRTAQVRSAVEWYKKLSDNKIPYLICMTGGDELFDDCKCKGGDDMQSETTIRKRMQTVKAQVTEKTNRSPFSSVAVVSLKSMPIENRQEIIHRAGVLGIKDVGRWITESLHVQFKDAKIAEKLKKHFGMFTLGILGLKEEPDPKQALIQKLFKICGCVSLNWMTRQENQSLAPIRYAVQGVEDFDVVDFPSIDQDNVKITEFLQALCHLAIFVVNYRYANRQSALEWYKRLKELEIPYLICLTNGERLFDEEGGNVKQAIQDQLQSLKKRMGSTSTFCSTGIFCLSDDGQKAMYDAGISSIKEVRKWILDLLIKHYKGSVVIEELQRHFEV